MNCFFKDCKSNGVFNICLDGKPFVWYCPEHFVFVVKGFHLSKDRAVELIKNSCLSDGVKNKYVSLLLNEEELK